MTASQHNEINVEHLAVGVYILTIEENNKLIGRNKFIISK
ncbi:MAG: T9SS type A sorting domain-containing protein [Bacteroidales bacterium]|nr:T9SS type A sorting domain-containing protein [Bacteroidales bacterium]